MFFKLISLNSLEVSLIHSFELSLTTDEVAYFDLEVVLLT